MSIDRIPGAPASDIALAQSAARPTPTPVRPSVSFGAVLAATTKPLSAAVSALPGSSLLAPALRNGRPSHCPRAVLRRAPSGVRAG